MRAAPIPHRPAHQAPQRVIRSLEKLPVTGVDSNNRGQVFELLTSLDLDLMLTSDHEWCSYREIPGIAVHNLLTGDDGDDAVTTARFVWTGTDWFGEEERPVDTIAGARK